MEILRMNGDLDELVARRCTVREIRHLADRQGFVSLADDGLRRVLDGSTSIEELGRVVDLTDRM
jgi:general secretion pathway protein E/type IV pilus assembly protein PilB